MKRFLRTFGIFVTCLAAARAQTETQVPAVLKLSLDEAIQRGLKNNLGVLERESADRTVRAERIRALSALVPTVTAYVAENLQKNNIAVFGFRIPGFPHIIRPFGDSDARPEVE